AARVLTQLRGRHAASPPFFPPRTVLPCPSIVEYSQQLLVYPAFSICKKANASLPCLSTEPSLPRPAALDKHEHAMKKIALACFRAASLGAAHAQTYEVVQPVEARPLRFLAGGGLTFGGDKLATAVYEDGTEIDIDAGGMIAFHV